MNSGNVQPEKEVEKDKLASSGQINELRLAMIRAFDKMVAGRLQWTTAEGWGKNSRALEKLMEQLLPPAEEVPVDKIKLKPWKRFKVGGSLGQIDLDGLCDQHHVDTYATGMLKRMVAEEDNGLDFVVLTPKDFGFTERPSTRQLLSGAFCSEWSERCLDGQTIALCLPHDGIWIRKLHSKKSQTVEEWNLRVAMDPVADRNGKHPSVFNVGRGIDLDDPTRFEGNWVEPHDLWSLDQKIIFRLYEIPTIAQ